MQQSKNNDIDDALRIDKISDDVFIIGQNLILKFNVALSKISAGKRYYYYKEFEYQNNNFNRYNLISVKRSFDYYLSFESIKADYNAKDKLFVRIGITEFPALLAAMDEVYKWFTDVKYQKLYMYDKSGKLIMTSPIPSHTIPKLPMGKSMTFQPTIICKGIANADNEIGVSIDFSDFGVVDVDIDKFIGLRCLLSNLNMYQAASTIISQLERSTSSENRIVMEGSYGGGRSLGAVEEIKGTGINERFPKGYKSNISQLEG